MVRIGILGCGSRSRAHIAALNGVPEIEIAALCDVVPQEMDQRAGMIRKKVQPRKYDDMAKMIAQKDLDAVAIVLPNHLHRAATIAALQAGRHVFCEKPMALTVADCNDMIAASERAGKVIQIGTQRRHAPGYKQAVEAIRKAPVGPRPRVAGAFPIGRAPRPTCRSNRPIIPTADPATADPGHNRGQLC